MRRVVNNNTVPTIQTSYIGFPEENLEELKLALAAINVESYTVFWKGCIDSLLAQSRQGELIAWPPAFALQDRDPEYVRLKLEHTKRYLSEQEKIKAEKEAKKKTRKRKQI